MNYTNNFTGKAGYYQSGRPKYARALFNYLEQVCGLSAESILADIGCGTGIFTEQLLQTGCTVYGIEPNADMRLAAKRSLQKYSRCTLINGYDQATGLPAHCVDFVTAAQAFHWFEPVGFFRECQRILKPGGSVIIIYNTRDSDSLSVIHLEQICRKYCPSFKGFSNGLKESDISRFFGGEYEKQSFDNPLVYDNADAFIQRILSSSYSLVPKDSKYGNYIHELRELFATYAKSPGVSDECRMIMPNHTMIYHGKITGRP